MKVKIVKKDLVNFDMWYNNLIDDFCKDNIYIVEECEIEKSYKLKNQPLYINKEHCEIIEENNGLTEKRFEEIYRLCTFPNFDPDFYKATVKQAKDKGYIIKNPEEEFEELYFKIEELKDSFMEGEAEEFLDKLYTIGKKAIQYYKEK